jgi:hypothetical protein
MWYCSTVRTLVGRVTKRRKGEAVKEFFLKKRKKEKKRDGAHLLE